MTTFPLSFTEFNQRNPCAGCPAPCCRMQLIPFKAPVTFMDIDFIRYLLLFRNTEMAVSTAGEWSIVKWEECSALDVDTCLCRLHNTPQKPHTCTQFNPYNCWYKNNFVLEGSQDVYRLDLKRFDVWVKEVQFAEDGRIIAGPDFERSMEILQEMPIERHFVPLSESVLTSDPRFEEIVSTET